MSKKPYDKLFADNKPGRQIFKGLKHKDTNEPLTDLEYFEVLGRKAIEMDKENPYPNVPTDYGNMDRNVVEVAKTIVKGLDEGKTKSEMNQYLQSCIEID